MRINFSPLVGTQNQFFTLFQFFGPISGGFLGAGIGAVAVGIANVVDFLFSGKSFDVVNILRLTPMIFAAYYFGCKNNRKEYVGIIVPLLAIVIFNLNPVARGVWYFSLYWLIPVVVRLIPSGVRGQLFLRSLGSTMTAHAVGGAIWAWTIPMTTAAWIALIPVVAYERFLFTIGIAVSYVAMKAVLKFTMKKFHVAVPEAVLRLNERNA